MKPSLTDVEKLVSTCDMDTFMQEFYQFQSSKGSTAPLRLQKKVEQVRVEPILHCNKSFNTKGLGVI